jgi:hypothetical protein
MRGWIVIAGTDYDTVHILCRAETRARARTFWPGEEKSAELRVKRAPWLDGGDEEVDVMGQWSRCEGPYDADGECIADHHHWEGEYLDQEKTLAALGE